MVSMNDKARVIIEHDDTEVDITNPFPTEVITRDIPVSTNNPLPTDGDSVYAKDIWVDECVWTDWSGTPTDLFDNPHSQVTNTTSDDPKSMTIHFQRGVVASSLALGCTGGGDFSNVKIKLVGSGEVSFTVIDQSTNDTKYTSRAFLFPVIMGFNAVIVEFHTTDTVTLSSCSIGKSTSVIARLQAVKPDSTVADINATTGGNLKVSMEEFENTFYDDPLPVISGAKATRLDETSTADVTYVGTAVAGTLTSASLWQIKKLDETGDLIITYADGDADSDNIWDDRASLSYS